MELMQLEMFVAIVEEGSVRMASERVLRTQPALSIALRKLEEEFGARLFDRSKRYSFRLTQAGEALYRHAKRMLSVRSEAVSDLREIAELRAGRLAIGANESVSVHLVPQIARGFLEKHPGMRLELKCLPSEDVICELKARKLDVAIVSFRPDDPDLASAFLVEDELVVITHPKHALARATKVPFQELAEEPMLMMDISPASPWHKRVADAFFRHKIPFQLKVENAPIEAIKKMVRSGLGVGFVPYLAVREEISRRELLIVDVAGFREVRSVWAVRRWANESPAVQAALDVACSVARQMVTDESMAPALSRNKVVPVNRRA